jgi:hypothetical protein
MDAFDAIETGSSIYEIADEWSLTSVISHASAKTTTFGEDFLDVSSSYRILQSAVSRGDRRASEIAHQVLEEALIQIASVEVKLEHLLALEYDRALLILEAIQLVGPSNLLI